MKYIFLLSICFITQNSKAQTLNMDIAHKMLTTSVTMAEVKKLLSSSYNFISQSETSTAGNINYQFESKSINHYVLNILYSTAFDRIAYIQVYDDIKQAGNYRGKFLKLGFTYLTTNYSTTDGTRKFGYVKGNLMYVVELGVELGQCKIHLENKDY